MVRCNGNEWLADWQSKTCCLTAELLLCCYPSTDQIRSKVALWTGVLTKVSKFVSNNRVRMDIYLTLSTTYGWISRDSGRTIFWNTEQSGFAQKSREIRFFYGLQSTWAWA